MGLFSWKEKLYFVFVGRSDRFYCDSLLHLDLETLLWSELRQDHYQSIFYIQRQSSAFRLRVLDHSSHELYNNTRPSPWFQDKYLMYPDQNSICMGGDRLRKWLDDRVRKNGAGNMAVVFPLLAFSELYDSLPARRQLDSYINSKISPLTFIIQVPMQLDSNHHAALMSKGSVFTYHTAVNQALCPSLAELIAKEDGASTLETWKLKLGRGFIELGSMHYERLKSLMRCVCFQRREVLSEERLLYLTNILYNWWYIRDIQAKVPLRDAFVRIWMNHFGKEERRQEDIYRALYQYLCSSNGWKKFLDRVAVTEKNDSPTTRAFLKSYDRSAFEDRCQVTLYNSVLACVADKQWPARSVSDVAGKQSELAVVSRGQWDEMLQTLRMPHFAPLPSRRLDDLADYLYYFDRARENKDHETVCRAANAICFAGLNLYRRDSEAFSCSERFQTFKTYLEYSARYFALHQMAAEQGQGGVMGEAVSMMHGASAIQYRQVLEDLDQKLRLIPQVYQAPAPQTPASMYLRDVEMTQEEAEQQLRHLERSSGLI